MKRLIIFLVFSLMASQIILSQNLLYNGGFEDGDHYGDNLYCSMITNNRLDNWETDCKVCDNSHAGLTSFYYPHSPDWFDKTITYCFGNPPYEGNRMIGMAEYELIEQSFDANFAKNDILYCKFQLKRVAVSPHGITNNFSGMKMNIYLAKEKIKYKSDDDISDYCEHKDFLNSQSLFLAKSIDLNDMSLGYSDWNKISFFFEAPDPSYNWFAIEIVRTNGTCDHDTWSYVLLDDVQLMHYCNHPCMNSFPPIEIFPSKIPDICFVNANPGVWYINVINAQRIELFITDQWGGIHYFTDYDVNGLIDVGYNDYQFVWNGYFSDHSLMPEDTYHYRLVVSNCNETVEKFGFIHVIYSSQVDPLIVIPSYKQLDFADDDCCLSSLMLSNIVDVSNYYLVSNSIETTGQYLIPSGESVTFDAGLDITLGSGFHADYGSTFTAKICGCKENSRYALNSNNHNQFVREPSEKFAALSNLKNQFDYVDRVEVQIFPNPASNILNINSNVEIIRVELIDNLGFAIYSMEVHGLNRVQTDVSNIESGLYQVRIITADNSVFVKSFVKTN